MPDHPRVAVIAVHGIADQRRGDTGQAVALQLAAAGGGRVQTQDLPLAVPPLDPAVAYKRWWPKSWMQRGRKSLRQSWRSDFLDRAIGAEPGSAARPNSALSGAADVGVRFTDYLLAKAQGARKNDEAEPANVSVSTVDGPQLHADVFEMYWADLSRLPGSVTRIVSELFTLLFHLSRLGVDTLSLAEGLAGRGPLTWLARVQRGADWLFSRVLALLALQLVVCGLVLAPVLLGAAHSDAVHALAVALAGIGSAAAWVYFAHGRWRLAIPIGALLGWGVWNGVHSEHGNLGLMLAWLAVLTLVYGSLMRYIEQRFAAVLGIGMAMYAATLGTIALRSQGADFDHKQGWINGTLGALEAVLLAHAVLWAALALLLAASVLLSEWALWRTRPRDDRADYRTTLVTARLGLFTSVGAFLVVLMVGFLLVSRMLRGLLGTESYTPWWFCKTCTELCASVFLDQRAQGHAGTFAPVLLFLLGLIGFVALVFAPSVLRELRLAAPKAGGLGRWLSTGYRAIEWLVRLWGIPLVPVAIAVVLVLLAAQAGYRGIVFADGMPALLPAKLESVTQQISTDWLETIVYAIAGGTVGLLAIGKIAIKQLQALRAPLDAALDVDNHFREFPRDAISRVRIVERYVALLDHVRRQGYQRVVIVAHSQGTVITADLLRYLQQRDRLGGLAEVPPDQVDPRVLRYWLAGIELRLLTVGSPLRQLYALRFPALYPWVMAGVRGADDSAWVGPQPHELGLQRWSNLWGSGDYVGRWLWSKPDASLPRPLQVNPASYDGFRHQGQDAQGRHWKDGCIGADAHTHYFDLEQRQVAAELLDLATRA